jgi:hypothetical protein
MRLRDDIIATAASLLLLVACDPAALELGPDGAPDGVDDADDDPGTDDELQPATCGLDPATTGDTNPCTRMLFPADAFYDHATGRGRILDVTRAPFNAKGDGVADDTAALVAAYDFVMNRMAASGWDGFFQKSTRHSYIIYLPDGVYRVRNSVIYSGAVREHPIGNTESLAWIRIIGESRAGTIVRLDANAPDFAAGKPLRPVISFGKTDFNNLPASNSLRNLTVEVGANNPSAIGVKFGGANQSDIENVRIASLDPTFRGAVGLDDSIGTVLSYQRDVIVSGFDVGIRMVPYHFTMPTLEHVTLRRQRVAGVQVLDGLATIRKLRSINQVPAVLLSRPGNHVVVLDSQLIATAAPGPAVKIVDGHFFGRHVAVSGYASGVVKGSKVALPCSIDEYVSDPVLRFSTATPARSLDLPIDEVPRHAWRELSQWVKPATPGDGVADASPAIRAAMPSGKSTVYFPGHEYRMASTVDIPCSVERVNFLFATVTGGANTKCRVLGGCTNPLRVQDVEVQGGVAFDHVGPRPLVLQRVFSQGFTYRNSSAGTPTLYASAVGSFKVANPLHDMRAFLRSVDGESYAGHWQVERASVSILGFKSEKSATAFIVKPGGKLEVLGGVINQYTQEGSGVWPGTVAIRNENGDLSMVAATNGPSRNEGFETLVRDTQGATTRSIRWDSPVVPDRVGRQHQEIIPLYVSY